MPFDEKLQLLLKIIIEDTEYQKEYEQFVSGYSYLNRDQIPNFAKAIETLNQLVDAVTELNHKLKY